jgi:hypothetical protein
MYIVPAASTIGKKDYEMKDSAITVRPQFIGQIKKIISQAATPQPALQSRYRQEPQSISK